MTDIQRLPETARGALRQIIKLLGGGFTGQITLECGEGGVRNMATTTNADGRALRDQESKVG